MTNKELKYFEANCPSTIDENLNFKKFQLHLYRLIYKLIQHGFSRYVLIEKLRELANCIIAQSKNYFYCNVIESVDYIRVAFYIVKYPTARALFEIKYDD